MRTHKLLSDSLFELMKKKPFEKITITDICDNAMVHRTTFYAHFHDKYDLLKASLKYFDEAFETGDIEDVSIDGYKKYYRHIAKNVLTYVAENFELFKMLLRKNKKEFVFAVINNFINERLTKKLEQCSRAGIDMKVPVPILSNLYSGGCSSVLIWWIENDMPVSSNQLLEYFDVCVNPIL